MISSEVQRTLVKSPPELWRELSDPIALARHLGEFGEIRITRVEAEKTVEWESESARGTVLIKPSGWGTKVTLSVTRDFSLPEDHMREPAAASEAPAPVDDAEPAAATPGVELDEEPREPAALEEPPEPVAAEEPPGPVAVEEPAEPVAAEEPLEPVATEDPPEPAEIEPETEPRRGFLARLFGRRRRPVTERPPRYEAVDEQIDPEPPADIAAERTTEPTAEPATDPVGSIDAVADPAPGAAVGADEPEALDEPAPAEPAEPALDLAAELVAAEEVAAEEVTAVLTGVLDRLGAAHHRPFSRS